MSKTAEEIDDDQDDIDIDQTEEMEDDAEEVEETSEVDDDIDEDDDDDEDEVIVSIAGEAPPPEEDDDKKAPKWVRDVRADNREKMRRIKELEQKLAKIETQEIEVVAPLGPMPTLEDVDYDTERFQKDTAKWFENKRQHDEQHAAIEGQKIELQRKWERKLEGYQSKKSGLKVRDFELAEDVVQDTMTLNQQSMIVMAAKDPALLIYAIGKNPKKAKELADLGETVEFAFAVGYLEAKVNIENRKAQVLPEKKVTGSGRISGSVDKTLDRLRSDAEKTGDYSKVFAYKRKNK
jgi:ATP-dependent protease HslVU (ClpYQ) peptidase subunit